MIIKVVPRTCTGASETDSFPCMSMGPSLSQYTKFKGKGSDAEVAAFRMKQNQASSGDGQSSYSSFCKTSCVSPIVLIKSQLK